MPAPIIDIILEDPSRDDLHGIVATLDAYNEAHAGMADLPGFAVLLRDAETGTTIGGLYAADGYGWAFIRYLAVPDEYRGQGLGRRLIEEAEKIARVGLWLDIFEFQARPFYEKLGFLVFGELEGGEGAIARYFLKKRFF